MEKKWLKLFGLPRLNKMVKITIDVDDRVLEKLKKRADKNLLSVKEQIEDIVRRSTVNFKSRVQQIKVDDRLVGIFSRQRSGRKRKKKKGKK